MNISAADSFFAIFGMRRVSVDVENQTAVYESTETKRPGVTVNDPGQVHEELAHEHDEAIRP